MIKNYKRILYKEEASFGEAYNKASNFKEFLVADDFKLNRVGEKLETIYENKERQMNARTTTGRVTGDFSTTKNLDKSWLAKHSDLVNAGLGKVEGGTTSAATITAIATTSNITTLTIGADWSALIGLPVRITYTDGTVGSINIVESATATEVTLKIPFEATELAKIQAGDELEDMKRVSISKPQNTKTFQFIVEYDDDSIELLQGCGVQIQIPFNTEGKSTVPITIKSAKVSNLDSSGAVLDSVSGGTITTEGTYQAVYYDFILNYVSDMATTPAPKSVVAQQFALNIAQELQAWTHQGGGVNNILGWWTKANVTAEAFYNRNDTNLVLFGTDNENSGTQWVFLGQQQVAFYAPVANFTNGDADAVGEFDSLKYNVDVNHDTSSEPFIVLPQ